MRARVASSDVDPHQARERARGDVQRVIMVLTRGDGGAAAALRLVERHGGRDGERDESLLVDSPLVVRAPVLVGHLPPSWPTTVRAARRGVNTR